MTRLTVWLSPWEHYESVEQIVEALANVHLPGHTTEVLIPTVYDDTPQYWLRNNLGPGLKVSNPDSAAGLRQQFRDLGLECGGWSVPRGTGNAGSEGAIHGAFAAQFDHFNLNWEEGWQDFWAREGAAPVNQFLQGYWGEVEARGRTLDVLTGITFVPNTAMLGAATPQETAAWVGGSEYVAIETYLPGDPGLDPAKGRVRMGHELEQAGYPDFPVVNMLEHGDLPALAAQFTHPVYGIHIWTIGAAIAHTWPIEEPPPEPVTPPEVDDVLQALAYIANDVTGPLRDHPDPAVSSAAAEVDRVAQQYGAI